MNKFYFKKGGKTAKESMPCNKPRRIRKGEPGYDTKEMVVKGCENGKEKLIKYGDANMTIKKSDPERRKSFRARHGCDKGNLSKLSAKYWSCKRWEDGGKFYFKTGGLIGTSTQPKQYKHGGIIAGGVLHSEKNEIGDRGIPVVPMKQFMQSGGKYDKNAKIAEIEASELIVYRETAESIDRLVDEYNDCGCGGKLVALGQLIYDAFKSTTDETCRTKCEFKPKLDKIK